jgi:hypothetical protein
MLSENFGENIIYTRSSVEFPRVVLFRKAAIDRGSVVVGKLGNNGEKEGSLALSEKNGANEDKSWWYRFKKKRVVGNR